MRNNANGNESESGTGRLAQPGRLGIMFNGLAQAATNKRARYGALAAGVATLVVCTWITNDWFDSNSVKVLEVTKREIQVSRDELKATKHGIEESRNDLEVTRKELVVLRKEIEESRIDVEQSKKDLEERVQTIYLVRWAERSGPPRVNAILSSLIMGYRWRWELIEPYSRGWTRSNWKDRVGELDAKLRVLMGEAENRRQLDPELLESAYSSSYDKKMKRRLWADREKINDYLTTAIRYQDVDGICDALGRWRDNNNAFFVLASRRLNEVILTDFSLPHGNENLWPPDLRIVLGTLRLAVAIQFEVIEPYYDHSLLDFAQRATRMEYEVARVLNETERSGFVNKVRTLSAFEDGELRDRITRTFDESERFMPALRAALTSKDQKLIEVGLKKWRITNYNYMRAAAERCVELTPIVAEPQQQDEKYPALPTDR